MAYQKKSWKDRQSETPNRRRLTPIANNDGVYDVGREEGCIFDEGSAFNQLNMNDLEDRISAGFTQVVDGSIKAGRAGLADSAATCTGNAATATVAASASSVIWTNVSGKPATFAPAAHTHDERYYTEDEVNNLINGRIPVSASCNKNWNWSGQEGQPTWMWGGADATNQYLYNPSNFSVNYANTANYANSANSANSAGYANSAGSAGSATSATNSVNATNAGNADTVDGFHIAGKGTSAPGWLAENALYFVYE